MACARDMFVSIVHRTKTHGPGMRCEEMQFIGVGWPICTRLPYTEVQEGWRGGKERKGGNEIQQEPSGQDKAGQELRQCDACVGENQLKWKSHRPIDGLNIH